MTKANSKKQKKPSKFKELFDNGNKFVSKHFIAFHLPDDNFSFHVIASKKVGNAVARNFCKRRLRELSKQYIQPIVNPMKIVLLSRVNTSQAAFSDLIESSKKFIKTLNQ